MILIQIVLITVILILLGWFLSNPTSHGARAWKKIMALIFTTFAITMIIFPDEANSLAHFFGVKRGADLLLYGMSLAFIFFVLDTYLRMKRDQERIVKLARKIAIIEAKANYKK